MADQQKKQPLNKSENPESKNHRSDLIGAGTTISGSVLGLSLLGYYLDYRFGWKPWALLTGALLGIVVGMYELWKLMFRKDRC